MQVHDVCLLKHSSGNIDCAFALMLFYKCHPMYLSLTTVISLDTCSCFAYYWRHFPHMNDKKITAIYLLSKPCCFQIQCF